MNRGQAERLWGFGTIGGADYPRLVPPKQVCIDAAGEERGYSGMRRTQRNGLPNGSMTTRCDDANRVRTITDTAAAG
jgi:hypothetical protein